MGIVLEGASVSLYGEMNRWWESTMENQEVFASSLGAQKIRQPSLQSKILRILLTLVLVLGGFFVFDARQVFAADDFSISIRDDMGRADHRSLRVGTELGPFDIWRSSSSLDIKSSTWKSSNENVISIYETADGIYFKALAEGNSVVTLTAQTSEGKLSDTCLVSSITAFDITEGYVSKDAGLYRGARDTSTQRAVVPSGQKLSVYGVCESYYRVVLPESYYIDDDLGSTLGYIAISSILIPVTTVSLDKTSENLYPGDSSVLKATVLPEIANDKDVSWASSDTEVATVSSSGKITAKTPGKATITVKTKDGGKSATCKVTVSPIAVSSIALDKTSLSLKIGSNATLKATIAPANATDKTMKWSSSNTSVATADSTGKVSAKGVGSTTITVTTTDGSKKATCTVTVSPIAVSSITLDKESLRLKIGDSATLNATIMPEDATDKTITWSSSDTSVATISSTGKVTTKGVGSVTISATTADGLLVASCVLKVNPIKVTGVRLDKTILSLTAAKTATLKTTITPTNATNKAVTWKSSDTSVATVDATGKVTAVKVGTATITVTTKDGSKKATCSLKVNPIKVTGVTLDKVKLSLRQGATFSLKATVLPENATNKAVSWKSSSKRIASVDQNGKVTALRPGSVTVTVTTKDGIKKAICKITIFSTVAAAPSTNGFSVSIAETGAKGKNGYNKIEFTELEDAEYYLLLRKDPGSKTYVQVPGKTLYSYDTPVFIDSSSSVKLGKTYSYKVEAYRYSEEDVADEDEDIADEDIIDEEELEVFSASGEELLASATASVTTGKTQLTAESLRTSVELTWTKMTGVTGYKIYRYATKNSKKGKLISSIGKVTTYTNKGLKPNKNYYYKVVPYNKQTKLPASSLVKAKTKKTAASATTTYMKGRTGVVVKNKASTTKEINKQTVTIKEAGGEEREVLAPIKYYYDARHKRLEIHIYAKFRTKNETSGRETSLTFASTASKLFRKGVNKYLSGQKMATANYSYTTKVIWHDGNDAKAEQQKQRYIWIYLGGRCKHDSCPYGHGDNLWYHAHGGNPLGEVYAGKANFVNPTVYMPTATQVKGNTDGWHIWPKEGEDYLYTAAHEMGHIFGLWDGYYSGVDRMTENTETSAKRERRYDNVMIRERDNLRYLPNDLEMMLAAYSKQIARPSTLAYQYYKTHPGMTVDQPNVISKEIENKKDYVKGDNTK
jgi:uncharacterized protein YjdB